MGRIERVERRLKELETLKEAERKPKKKWKPKFRVRTIMKQGKKPGKVLVLYLTQKYEARFKVQPIVSGNLVVIDNKVHVLNPKKIWRYGKYIFYIIREIDRKPVSNFDYDEVKERGDDTENDVPLIKAVLGAIQKPSALKNKGAWIAIGIIAVVAVALYFLFAGS